MVIKIFVVLLLSEYQEWNLSVYNNSNSAEKNTANSMQNNESFDITRII